MVRCRRRTPSRSSSSATRFETVDFGIPRAFAAAVLHDERPRERGRVSHGLQIFVNLPSDEKRQEPRLLFADGPEVPVLDQGGVRVRVAILDVTGVLTMDEQVASGLLRAAQASRLLGAQMILSGIRPEVARALVGTSADLSRIITCGNLQAAITYAMHIARAGGGAASHNELHIVSPA